MAQITTEEFWDVDGVPLNTYAYNIATLNGRTSTPGSRGEDKEQAYRPGRSFRPKVADSRTLTLAMWVLGSDPDDFGGPAPNPSAQFWTNLRMLQRLFYDPARQFTLTKRWRDLDGLHVASALGQVTDEIEPSHTPNRAAFVVDVFLADPFFYDTTPVEVNVALGSTVSTENPGDDTSPSYLTVSFVGPLTNPSLRNTTPSPDIVLSYVGDIPAGQTVVVDVESATAKMGSTQVNNNIRYSGSIWPMQVFRGNNSFALTAGSGSGSAVVSYRPAYF